MLYVICYVISWYVYWRSEICVEAFQFFILYYVFVGLLTVQQNSKCKDEVQGYLNAVLDEYRCIF